MSSATAQAQVGSGPQYIARQRPRALFQHQASFKHKPRNIEKAPPGYPRLATFLNTDKQFALFRRYGYLRTRVLLSLQDELAELEEKLDELDTNDSRQFNLASRRSDTNQTREILMTRIHEKLAVYDAAMETYFRGIERTRPRDSQVSSVTNWLNGNRPIVAEESGFLDDWEDLACPQQALERAGLEHVLEACGAFLKERGWARFLSTSREASKTDDPNVLLLSNRRMYLLARSINMMVASIVLTLPIVVLYWLAEMKFRLLAITAFTFLFSALLCGFTKSRNYEIFSATAAYCAVLVVFVGNLP